MTNNERRSKRPNRSNSYQALFLETAVGNDVLASFCLSDSIYAHLNPFSYDERVLDLKDELNKEFWIVINTMLTARQKEVLILSASGKTQSEIAKILGVNQSSITKSINGNVDYKNGRTIYGGTISKITKIVKNHKRINELVAQIRELQT